MYVVLIVVLKSTLRLRAVLIVSGKIIEVGCQVKRERLHLVDGFRGLAALAVVFWHYQHFYIVGDEASPASDWLLLAPLSDYLEFFYSNGHLAVEFFWVLSGFVFFYSFSGTQMALRDFFIGRFSRIYPLHFVTLIVVATLQIAFYSVYGYQKIWHDSDISAFIAQIFLASNWLSGAPFSFNAPIWSVSAEIVSYVLFFIIVLRFRATSFLILIFLVLSFFLLRYLEGQSYVLACGYFFFFGCFIGKGFIFLKGQKWLSLVLALLFGLLAFCAFLLSPDDLKGLFTVYFVTPSTSAFIILALCWLERHASKVVLKGSKWLGSISFGVYLWHVPIQILILFVLEMDYDVKAIAGAPLFLLFFFCLVVAVAHFSFVWIERPARGRIRTAFSGGKARALLPR